MNRAVESHPSNEDITDEATADFDEIDKLTELAIAAADIKK